MELEQGTILSIEEVDPAGECTLSDGTRWLADPGGAAAFAAWARGDLVTFLHWGAPAILQNSTNGSTIRATLAG